MIRRILVLPLLMIAASFAAKPSKSSVPDALASLKANDSILQDMLRRFPKDSLPGNDSIRAHLDSMFDFGELGKRALGKTWSPLAKVDQDSFQVHFSGMVRKKALESPQDYLSDSAKYEVVGKSTKDQAIVRSTVFRGPDQTVITYSLHKVGAAWRVFDLKQGEKPSQMEKYRDQFSKYLAKKTFKDLLATLKKNAGH